MRNYKSPLIFHSPLPERGVHFEMMETERPFLAQPVPKSHKRSFEKLDAALWIAVSACRLSLLCVFNIYCITRPGMPNTCNRCR